MSNKELASRFGMYESFFQQLKARNKDWYDFVFSFDINRANSVDKYIEYVTKVTLGIEEVLNSFDKPADYGKFMFDAGLSKCTNRTRTFENDSRTVFVARFEDQHYLSISVDTIKKWLKIIEAFKSRNVA